MNYWEGPILQALEIVILCPGQRDGLELRADSGAQRSWGPTMCQTSY